MNNNDSRDALERAAERIGIALPEPGQLAAPGKPRCKDCQQKQEVISKLVAEVNALNALLRAPRETRRIIRFASRVRSRPLPPPKGRQTEQHRQAVVGAAKKRLERERRKAESQAQNYSVNSQEISQ